jgi:hypothetical protein
LTGQDRPQVYVSQNQGYIVDTMITRGTDEDVDVIFIDWSEITPDHGDYSEIQLDTLEEAAEASLRLPKETAIGNLNDMIEFLEKLGIEDDDEFTARIEEALIDLRGYIADMEMNR